MTHKIECEGCGDIIREESLHYGVNFMLRKPGGGGVLQDGVTNVDWKNHDEYGDLCSECAGPVIELLNVITNEGGVNVNG